MHKSCGIRRQQAPESCFLASTQAPGHRKITHTHTHAHPPRHTHGRSMTTIIHVPLCKRWLTMFHIFLANGSSFVFFYENLLKTDTPFPFLLYHLPVQSVCRSYQPAFSQICSWSQHPETSEEASLVSSVFYAEIRFNFFACSHSGSCHQPDVPGH